MVVSLLRILSRWEIHLTAITSNTGLACSVSYEQHQMVSSTSLKPVKTHTYIYIYIYCNNYGLGTRTSQLWCGKGVAAVTSATRVWFALGKTIYIVWVPGKKVKTLFFLTFTPKKKLRPRKNTFFVSFLRILNAQFGWCYTFSI